MQDEAAQKAVMEADPEMRTIAASSAALAVATGFDSGSSVGVSYTNAATECTSVEEDDEKEKVWTITCVDADGISSKKCQNGKVLSGWELKFQSSEDAKRVDEFLAEFKNDENLRFAGMKDF